MKTAIAHLAALAALAAVLAHGGVARAETASPSSAPWRALAGAPPAMMNDGRTISVDLKGGSAVRSVSLPRGKSAVVELPVDARDVLVSDPDTADVVLSSARRIYILGKKQGVADATFVDGMGRQILRLNIRVDSDTSAVAETLNRVLPGASVHVEAINDSLILTGEVPNAADADKALRIAGSFVDKPEKVLNMLAVAGPEQVMLKVRIVEVNRQVVKQLGVNLSALIAKVGNANFDVATAATYGVNGSILGGLTGASGYTSKAGATGEAVLQAYESAGLVRTLAEPNLTTVSGEAAKFLAGGEFPVPVGEDSTGRITVTFKQFGVGLGFTPVVLSPGRISLKISTEYSQLTNLGALTQAATSTSSTPTTPTSGSTTGSTSTTSSGSTSTSTPSVTIPGLTIRQAQTVIELPSGGSMMIAGLLQSITSSDIASLPGLTQLPVLGALFRSRDYQQQETELVVIVTPYLVKPSRADQLQTPADGLQIADDASTYLLGQLNKTASGGGVQPPAGKTYQGPFGYVVQ